MIFANGLFARQVDWFRECFAAIFTSY